MKGNVVVQVTNLTGTMVWAASTAIAERAGARARLHRLHVLQRPGGQDGPHQRHRRRAKRARRGSGAVHHDDKGPGFIFGFVYGGPIDHSDTSLIASLVVSFPLLILMRASSSGSVSGSPSRRSRRSGVASTPSPGGPLRARAHHRRRRRDRSTGPYPQRDARPARGGVEVPAGVRLEREPRAAQPAHDVARHRRAGPPRPRARQLGGGLRHRRAAKVGASTGSSTTSSGSRATTSTRSRFAGWTSTWTTCCSKRRAACAR